MATLVSDPLPQPEQHAVRAQRRVQAVSLVAVRHALSTFKSPQVGVVKKSALR
ncbi:hypothetical protein [Streptomyces sp. NPDC047525]|uniref:hypothetical protein n=1 Tax=Streptomyces sp. NPDC047525 TaxID=3155264 RepID=UPI0033F24279